MAMKLSELLKANPDLDCELDDRDGDIVSDIVVLARCVSLDDPGTDALIMSTPDHTTYIVQRGMLSTAIQSLGWQDGSS